MEWTSEAKQALKQAPPFMQPRIQSAVENYAGKKGAAVVTLEVFKAAVQSLMGKSSRKNALGAE